MIRGEGTETSDLDLVIFDQSVRSSYRESLLDFGWAIEVFVHNLTSYQQFFEDDCKWARPSLPTMVSEGIILKDDGVVECIEKEAKRLLAKGPEEWSFETINTKRYFITDALEDFIGCSNRGEELFIANTIAELASEFVLRTNRKWMGASKWTVRSLRKYDEEFTKQLIEAFDHFYRTGSKTAVIQLVDYILQPYGGRLFDGFSLGKGNLE